MPLYKMKKPEGNVVVQVNGIVEKFKAKEKTDHWLDRSKARFGEVLVEDVKATLKVLIIFIPLPIFWTLYDQQGSAWTFQASRMNGQMGSFTLLPDQMQVVNPLLILAFIPLFTYVVYPFFARFNILKTPLQRMAYGGFLAAAAYGITSGVSFAIEATYPDLPAEGYCQLRVYNPSNDCETNLQINDFNISIKLERMSYNFINIPDVSGNHNATYITSGCNSFTGELPINEATGIAYWITENGLVGLEDNIEKPDDGLPEVRTLVYNPTSSAPNLTYYDGSKEELSVNTTDASLLSIDPGTYKLGNSDLTFSLGGVYTVLVTLDNMDKVKDVRSFEITQPNSVHMMWLLPQYFVMTAAEILFSITGLEFSYAEAPASMKSVLQASFLLTSAVGDTIIVAIESAKIFEKKSYDFLLYTGLMILDMLVFVFLAVRYKYVNPVYTEGHSNSKATTKEGNKPLNEDALPIDNNLKHRHSKQSLNEKEERF